MLQSTVSCLQESLQVGSGEDTSRPALEGRGEGGHGALSGLHCRGHPQAFHLQGGENEVGDQSLLLAAECWELVSCPVGLTLHMDNKSQGSNPICILFST